MSESECPAYTFLNKENIYPKELEDEYDLKIISYNVNPELPIKPASGKRKWINETGCHIDKNGETVCNGYGKRCLPLVAANTLGWNIFSDQRYEVIWNGGPTVEDIKVTADNPNTAQLSSHFGTGTVTWHVGRVFYTTKGNFLYCKGPTNHFKHGIQACEGLIETDWLPFTFTMNWMITKPNEKIVFEKGEPICQLFPYPKEYAENFEAIERPKHSMPSELEKLYDYWCHSRDTFNKAEDRGDKAWEGNYFKGEVHDETSSEDLGRDHFVSIKMQKFQGQGM